MRIDWLGDQAVMIYCRGEEEATRLAAQVREANAPWCVDVVQAYLSVAVYYDAAQADGTLVAEWLKEKRHTPHAVQAGTLHRIPCCYELGLDFERIAAFTQLTRDQIIELHLGAVYTVYAIGFCPGFPYLGYLPDALANVPRLESPRLKVEAGSVGLTGRQTGIYTEVRPGGWNIIGRTPLQLVDVAQGYFPLRTGDRVQFERIDKKRFGELAGQRLPPLAA